MAYKMKGSPLQQGWGGSIIGSFANQQAQPQSQGVMGAINAAVSGASNLANQAAMSGQLATGTQTSTLAANMNPAPKAAVKYNMTKPGRVSANRTNIAPPKASVITPSAMQPAPINPRAVGNADMVKGVYGKANENTFTRTVQGNEAPIMQLANPELLQDGPQLPPEAVQTSVTPTLGFENS